MSLQKLKDVYFLGSMIKNIKGIFNKTNELVDAVNALETSTIPSYKVYTALLTQTGTSAPVATILENTLGTVNYAYDSIGNFRATSAGLFTLEKTLINLTPISVVSRPIFSHYQQDANNIALNMQNAVGAGLNDSLHEDNAYATIEIRVYN